MTVQFKFYHSIWTSFDSACFVKLDPFSSRKKRKNDVYVRYPHHINPCRLKITGKQKIHQISNNWSLISYFNILISSSITLISRKQCAQEPAKLNSPETIKINSNLTFLLKKSPQFDSSSINSFRKSKSKTIKQLKLFFRKKKKKTQIF